MDCFLPILAWTPTDPGVSLSEQQDPLSASQNRPSWNNSGHSRAAGTQGGWGPAAHPAVIPATDSAPALRGLSAAPTRFMDGALGAHMGRLESPPGGGFSRALHLPWGSEKRACGPLLTWQAAPPRTPAATWLSSGKDQPRSWVKLYLGIHPGLPTDCSPET